MNKLKLYYSRIVGHFKKGLNLVFWLLLVIVVILSFNVIRSAFKPLSNLEDIILDVIQKKGVRINFEGYGKVVDRIEGAEIFVPAANLSNNPFGVK